MDYKTPPRRVRRHRSALSIFLTILIIAAVTVGVIAAGIYFSGIRYITSNTEDGLTIKYFGRVDKDGSLLTGKLYYSDGMTAEVDMQKNSIVYSNGDIYEGGISDLKKNGTGKIIYASGDVYEGEFVNDKLTGTGKYSFANGDVYEGTLVDGKKDGTGTYTWVDGSSYTGSYTNDMKNGEGKYTWANGEFYEGSFVDNKMSGKGKYTWPSGRVYEGTFENGKIVKEE